MSGIRKESRGSGSLGLVFPVILLSTLVAVVTTDMVNPVLPEIRDRFRVSEADIGWVVSGVILVLAIGVPLYGRISDFFDTRRLFALALWIFCFGSLVCALAPTFSVLILGRVLQGAGSAAIPVLSAVVVARTVPSGRRGAAFGTIAATIGVGAAMGPVFGGVVGQFAGWSSLFWITFAVSLVLAPCVLLVFPRGSDEVRGKRGLRAFDLPGGLLLGASVGLFLFGITQSQVSGVASPISLFSFLLAALSVVVLVWRTGRVTYPFVPPELFANRTYSVAVAVVFLAMLVNLAVLVFVPVMVIEANGLSAGAAGLILLPGGIAVAVLSPLSGRMSDVVGSRLPLLLGLSAMMVSVLSLSTFAGGPALLVSLTVTGVGAGVAFITPAATNAAARVLSEEQTGIGMGLFQGALFLGGGTGPALFGAVLAARSGGNGPLNPLYTLGAGAYSDAYFAISAAVVIALVVALFLGSRDRTFG